MAEKVNYRYDGPRHVRRTEIVDGRKYVIRETKDQYGNTTRKTVTEGLFFFD